MDSYHSRTGDVSWYHGHYYAAKAPGLALLTTPFYLTLKHVHVLDLIDGGIRSYDSTTLTIWALGLVGVVLPAAVLLLLIRRVADDFEPGFGTAVAVTAGLATLILPFSTLFFDHVMAAALGFAAFFAVWSRPVGMVPLVGAGVLAGLAVTTEYPLALVALAVGIYAVALGARVRGLLGYGAGFAAGVAPLFAYNWWAFGSANHFPYEDAVIEGGRTGHDVLGANSQGLFGVGMPSFPRGVALLFSPTGLLTLAPVVAMGAVGIVLLYRRRRAEALLFGVIALGYLVYNSGYGVLFGGFTPGPRFLIPALPFLALGLAVSYRRFPLLTGVLAVSSALLMCAVTVTNPKHAWDGHWPNRIADGSFAGRGVIPFIPFFLLVVTVVLLLYRLHPPVRVGRHETRAAASLFGGWILVAFAGHRLLDGGAPRALAVAGLAAVVALASSAVSKTRPRTVPPRRRL